MITWFEGSRRVSIIETAVSSSSFEGLAPPRRFSRSMATRVRSDSPQRRRLFREAEAGCGEWASSV